MEVRNQPITSFSPSPLPSPFPLCMFVYEFFVTLLIVKRQLNEAALSLVKDC